MLCLFSFTKRQACHPSCIIRITVVLAIASPLQGSVARIAKPLGKSFHLPNLTLSPRLQMSDDIDADETSTIVDDDDDVGGMNDVEEMNLVTDAFIAALTFILIKSCTTCGSSTPPCFVAQNLR